MTLPLAKPPDQRTKFDAGNQWHDWLYKLWDYVRTFALGGTITGGLNEGSGVAILDTGASTSTTLVFKTLTGSDGVGVTNAGTTVNVNGTSLSTSISTAVSAITSLSTSSSTGIASLSTGILSLSTGLSTTNSNVASLSISTSSGLSTANSRITSLSTSTSSGLSTVTSSIVSLSTSTSSGLSTATSSIVSLSSGVSTVVSSVTSLSSSTSSGLSTANSGIGSLSTSASTGLSTGVSRINSLSTVIGNTTGTGAYVLTNTPTVTTPNIVGITNASNAVAGSVGEYVFLSAPNFSIASGVTTNVITTSFPAGDWDLSGVSLYTASTTAVINNVAAGVSIVTNMFGALGTYSQNNTTLAAAATAISPTPLTRLNLSSTTTVYFVIYCSFTGSGASVTCAATMTARRIR